MQVFQQRENIADLTKTGNTTLQLLSSVITIGGLQYTTGVLICDLSTFGAGGIDTGSIQNSTIYYIYAVIDSGSPALVASINPTQPTGFAQYKKIDRVVVGNSGIIFDLEITKGDSSEWIRLSGDFEIIKGSYTSSHSDSEVWYKRVKDGVMLNFHVKLNQSPQPSTDAYFDMIPGMSLNLSKIGVERRHSFGQGRVLRDSGGAANFNTYSSMLSFFHRDANLDRIWITDQSSGTSAIFGQQGWDSVFPVGDSMNVDNIFIPVLEFVGLD